MWCPVTARWQRTKATVRAPRRLLSSPKTPLWRGKWFVAGSQRAELPCGWEKSPGAQLTDLLVDFCLSLSLAHPSCAHGLVAKRHLWHEVVQCCLNMMYLQNGWLPPNHLDVCGYSLLSTQTSQGPHGATYLLHKGCSLFMLGDGCRIQKRALRKRKLRWGRLAVQASCRTRQQITARISLPKVQAIRLRYH